MIGGIALLGLLGAGTPEVRAAAPPGSVISRTFSVADGLPEAGVRDLAMGAPGELFVGTEAGVMRFDGDSFTRLPDPPGLSDTTVRALGYADGWLVVQSAGGLWQVRDGVSTTLELGELRERHAAVAPGRNGTMLVATRQGLIRLQPDGSRAVVFPLSGDATPRAVLEDETGIWLGADAGLMRWEGGQLTERGALSVRALLPDPDGMLVGAQEGLFRVDGTPVPVGRSCFVTDLARLRDGRVAASCGDGVRVGRPDEEWQVIGQAQGLPGHVVTAAAADGEGQLWLGLLGQGLVRLSNLTTRLWDRSSGLPSAQVNGLANAGEDLLVAVMGAGLRVGPDLVPRRFDAGEGSGHEHFRIGSDGRGGVYATHWQAIQRLTPLPAMQVPGSENLEGEYLLDSDGTLWVRNVHHGFLASLGAQPSRLVGVPAGLAFARLRSSPIAPLHAADVRGVFWRFERGRFAPVGQLPQACPESEVACLGERCWVACKGGTFVGSAAGFERLADAPYDLGNLMAAEGEVWATTPDSLIRLHPAPLVIGPMQGLPSVGFRNSGEGLARLGPWLVAITDQGVLWVRPTDYEAAPTAPSARIAGVEREGVAALDLARLDPGLLSVLLGDDSLADEAQLAFRFRLDQGSWSSPVHEHRLQLAGLAPGAHSLEVQASRAGGPWSPTPASLAFTILPPWHQRADVRLAAILVVALGVGGIWRERTRRLSEQLQHLREQESIRQTFGRFVTAEIAEDALAGRLPTVGETRTVTVLFADLRGFTALSERLEAPVLVEVLNLWLAAMVREIEARGGGVNKFMGDAVVALFGAPRPLQDAEDRAVETALAMVAATEALGPELEARYGVRLRVGVGVNSGEVVAGPVGAPSRMEYTVIGEAVNVAARLESLTRDLDADVLVSDATVRRLRRSAPLAPAGEHTLRGLVRPVLVWAARRA